MDRIKLTKYYVEPNKKYNIISVCVFRLKKSYHSLKAYYYGLKFMAIHFHQYFPNFYLRVYFDHSIDTRENEKNRDMWIPLLEELKKNSKVQLIKYYHPGFITKDGNYHIGLFGTLVRFIPLFNYINDNVTNVIVSDIDIGNAKIALHHMQFSYIKFINSASQFHFATNYCYLVNPRFLQVEQNIDKQHKSTIKYRILAGSIYSKIKFPKKILDNFLFCTKNLKEKKCLYLNKFAEYQGDIFAYGVDEFFINIPLLKYIEKNKIMFSVVIKGLRISDLIRYDKRKLEKPPLHISQFYKDILGKYYEPDMSLKDNVNSLVKFMTTLAISIRCKLSVDERTKYLYLFDNIINIIKTINDNNEHEKYEISREAIKCVLELKKLNPCGYDFIMYSYDTNKIDIEQYKKKKKQYEKKQLKNSAYRKKYKKWKYIHNSAIKNQKYINNKKKTKKI